MKIKEAYVHGQLKRLQKEEISFSRFVELLNEKANERESISEEQAKININTMYRQTGCYRKNPGIIAFKESDLIDWFKNGLHLKNFNKYDTI